MRSDPNHKFLYQSEGMTESRESFSGSTQESAGIQARSIGKSKSRVRRERGIVANRFGAGWREYPDCPIRFHEGAGRCLGFGEDSTRKGGIWHREAIAAGT
jgi:hypothetical protein